MPKLMVYTKGFVTVVCVVLAATISSWAQGTLKRAQQLVQAPAEQVISAAEAVNKGVAAYRAQNYTEAMHWFRMAAAQGNAQGLTDLGDMYLFGKGVPQDYAEALRWFRLASAQGYAGGQVSLAGMYMNGTGVPKNYAEALRLYRLAAAQGDGAGQNGLAIMYEFGWGAPKDVAQAIEWYRKAAAQGQLYAQAALKRLGASP